MSRQLDERDHSTALGDRVPADVAPADTSPRPPDGQRRDAGFTLIEALVAVALMTVAIIPVFSAVRASIAASSRSRSAAQVETLIVNVADRVNRADPECSYLPYVQAALAVQGWDTSLASVVEEHYAAADQPNLPGEWKPGACVGDAVDPTHRLVQRVTIQVSSPDGRASRSIQVVKSDV